MDLRRHTKDLHWYLRSLEEVAIRSLRDVSGIRATRVEGLTGVWTEGGPQQKLCAIGVGARRWVTYHGLALNVCPDLIPFSGIVPCGIGDRPVGSVGTALSGAGALLSPPDWGSFDSFGPGVGYPATPTREMGLLLDEYRYALLGAFEEVFDGESRRAGAPESPPPIPRRRGPDGAGPPVSAVALVAPGPGGVADPSTDAGLVARLEAAPWDPWAAAAAESGGGAGPGGAAGGPVDNDDDDDVDVFAGVL